MPKFDRRLFNFVIAVTALFINSLFVNNSDAAEDKGPYPLGLLNSQNLSSKDIIPWINQRRDITAHFFSINGEQFREIAKFDATYESCQKYLYKPTDLTYTTDKNFYGSLGDVPSGSPVRVVCSENINKFSLEREFDEISKLIARIEKKPRDRASFQVIDSRIIKLSKSIVQQGREIEKQNRKISEIIRKLDKLIKRLRLRR